MNGNNTALQKGSSQELSSFMEKIGKSSWDSIGKNNKSIIQASYGKKIVDCNTTEINSQLVIICELLGFSENRFPDEDSSLLLAREIMIVYPKFGLNEINIAFTLKARGQLNCNAEHFQNLSVEYFHKIMSAYKSQKRGIALCKRNDLIVKAELPHETQDSRLEDDKNEHAFNEITEYYADNKVLIRNGEYSRAYEHAFSSGKFFLEIEEKKKIKAEVISRLKKDIRKQELAGNSIGIGTFTGILNSPNMLKSQCRIDCFKKWVQDNY